MNEKPITVNNGQASIFDNVCWEDITIEDGVLLEIKGVPMSVIKYQDIRKTCSRLKVRGYKNATKKVMMQLIIGGYEYRNKNGKMPFPSRNDPRCSYRLINILFSDEFAADRIMFVPDGASKDRPFWERVRKSFVMQDDSYNKIFLTDDVVFRGLGDIDPGPLDHTWRELRTIWKGIITAYKSAVDRFHFSGMRASNFYDACDGNKYPYYVRKHLELNPNATAGGIDAELPPEVFLDSMDLHKKNVTFDRTESSSKSKQKRKRKRSHTGISEIVEVLREINKSKREMAKKELEYLQKKEELKEKEVARKEKEVAQKEKEVTLKEKEVAQRGMEEQRKQHFWEKQEEQRQLAWKKKEERQEERCRFKEWHEILNSIRQLRKDMQEENDKVVKADMMADIEQLMKWKKKLSDTLDWD